MIERIRQGNRGNFRYAVFDFDGTLSLIREGWQQIMTPYFTDELMAAPLAKEKSREEMETLAREFITQLTGRQTIYQCIRLGEEIARLGGQPEDPQVYKDEYQRRLLEHIDSRLSALEEGKVQPEDMVVPGSHALLKMLQSHGVQMYLASGTDQEYVKREAALLRLDGYFGEHIYGAQRDYKTFSKKMVIERILRENQLSGESLLGFGDGFVEIENVQEVGGYAVGVASNERDRRGIDLWKRERLIAAGASLIIPDYREMEALEGELFPQNR